MDDLSVCIPCYNENHETLSKLREDLIALGAEVIVVDDGSDNPFPESIKHGVNFGYGGALMTAIKNSTRPIIMTMDGDGQHTIGQAIKLYHAFKLIQDADMVIGVRRVTGEKFHRFLGRKFLNWTASFICTYWIPDLNSGARVFRRHIAIGYFPILCRTFSFTTSLTISMMRDGYRVEFFPIKVENRNFGKSKVNVLRHGCLTFYYILRNGVALKTRGIRKLLRNLRGISDK